MHGRGYILLTVFECRDSWYTVFINFIYISCSVHMYIIAMPVKLCHRDYITMDELNSLV